MAVEQDRHRSPAGTGGSHQLSKRWPARAQDLLDATLRLCFDHLHEPLRICLSQFDAQLFALADHSSSFGDQQRALTVRERMLHGRSALEVRFLDHLTHHFEHIDATSAAADDVGDSWHTLALVDPAEQELLAADIADFGAAVAALGERPAVAEMRAAA